MSDEASFEVHLRDRTRKDANSAAASFRKVHDAADGVGVPRAEKALKRTEKSLRKTERAARSYANTSRRAKKVNPFGEFGANSKVFRSPENVGRMWDEMVTGHRRFADSQRKARRDQSFAAFQKRQQNRSEMTGDLGGMIGTPALLAAGAGAFAAFETGKATLSAVKYRDEVLTGLTLITGSQTEANRVFERSIDLADNLGQDWQATVGGMQKLLAKGFEEDFATDLTKGLADLSIVAPDANISNLLLAIGQIKTAGKLQGDELNQLTEAGLNSDLMFKQLEKSLGKSRAEVLKLKEGGKLLADDVLPAILESIKTMTGKELGMAAEEATDTVAGRMRRLEQLPGRFFLSVAEGLERSNLDGALSELLDALDPESAAYESAVDSVVEGVQFTAEAVQAALPLAKEFGGAFAEAFSAFTGIDTSDSFIEAMKDPETREVIREWGERFGTLAGAIAKVLDLLVRFGPELASAGTEAFNSFAGGQGPMGAVVSTAQSVAGNMIDGFVDKLFGGTDQAFAGGAALASAADAGMRSREGGDIHSPSKKTAEVGKFMTWGLDKSLHAGIDNVKKAGQELGRAPVHGMQRSAASSLPAVAQGSASASGSGSSSFSIGDMPIIIQGVDGEAIKDKEELKRLFRIEMHKVFDGLVRQGAIQDE